MTNRALAAWLPPRKSGSSNPFSFRSAAWARTFRECPVVVSGGCKSSRASRHSETVGTNLPWYKNFPATDSANDPTSAADLPDLEDRAI